MIFFGIKIENITIVLSTLKFKVLCKNRRLL